MLKSMTALDEENRKKRSYTTINIPWALMDRIDAVLEKDDNGYARRSDFIYDCIRRRLRELGTIK